MTTKDIDYLVKKGWSIHDTSKNRVKRSITPHALNYIKENLPSRDGVILDVGCSLGHTTRELAGIFQDHLVFGLDISEEIISKATEIEENEKYDNLVFIQSDGKELRFIDNSIDAIFALNSITYLDLISDYRNNVVNNFVNESSRVLNENGALIASLNSAMLMGYKGEELAKKFFQETYKFDPKELATFSNSYKRNDSDESSQLFVSYIRELLLPQARELRTPFTKKKGKTLTQTDYFRNWLPFFNQDYLIRESTTINEKELKDSERNNFNQFGQYSKRYPFSVRNLKERKRIKIKTSSIKN